VSFQAYLDNIKAKTGKTPDDFKILAEKAGVYSPEMAASELVAWLKKDFDLGHGHSMAIWAVFKSKGWVHSPKKN
jgi:spore coat protein CotF